MILCPDQICSSPLLRGRRWNLLQGHFSRHRPGWTGDFMHRGAWSRPFVRMRPSVIICLYLGIPPSDDGQDCIHPVGQFCH